MKTNHSPELPGQAQLQKLQSYERTFVYLAFIAVAIFVALAYPAVTQGANTIIPLTYPGPVKVLIIRLAPLRNIKR